VVVAFGVTDCVPPLGGSVYVLPSLPLKVTCVALVDVTISVEEFPATTVAGLAEMATVGVPSVLLIFVDEHPRKNTISNKLVIARYGLK